MKNEKSTAADALRRKAEKKLKTGSAKNLTSLPDGDILKLIHELKVHQVELEMQNEELRQAKVKTEDAARDFADFYNETYTFSPAGYFNLAPDGTINNLNNKGALMLGKERKNLIQSNFRLFISQASLPVFNEFLQKAFATNFNQTCEINLIFEETPLSYVYLEGRVPTYKKEIIFTAVDITELKLVQEGRIVTNELLRIINISSTKEDLIRQTIRILKNYLGCEAIGIRLHEGYDYPYYETIGFSNQFVEAERYLCSFKENGDLERDNAGNPILECICGNILSGLYDSSKPFFTPTGSFWTNSTTGFLANTTEADRPARTRNRCIREGYESLGLFPMRLGSETFGLLQVNDRKKGLFTPQIISFLESFTNNLAIAMAQHQTREALKKSELLLAETQKLSKLGGWEYDAQTGATTFTEGIFDIYGVRFSEVSEGAKFYHPDDQQLVWDSFTKAINENLPYDVEVRLINARHENLWVRTIGKPVLENGKVVRIVGNLMDITDRKKAENIIRQNEVRLRELNATKDKFFSIIAHDLKNPFNSIIGFSNILADHVREIDIEQVEEYAEIIQKSSKRAMDLLTNLLEWSRLQTGRIEFHPEHIDLIELIERESNLLSDTAKLKSIDIAKQLPKNATAFADKSMIGTVLRNLISNALKFSHPGDKIVISVEQKSNEYEIAVIDKGIGIKNESLGKLFHIEESYSTTGTQNEQGTGLGLILCKEFIEKHKGEIWVESEAGKGSAFRFKIPII